MRDAVGRVESVAVLGGTSDIGLACARALVDAGARRVVLVGRDVERLEAAGASLVPAEVAVVGDLDALDTAAHGRLVDDLFAAHGDLDVVVQAVGVLADQGTAEAEPEVAVNQARVNDVAVVSTGLHVARHLRHQGHGVLVHLSSVAAVRPRRANFAYGASKAAGDAFARGLDQALRGSGARVLIVRPGFVRTTMTAGMDAPPLTCDPADVGAAVRQALAQDRRVVYVPAAMRAVAAVLRVLPDQVLARLPR